MDAFLEAHDSGLSEADKEVAKGKIYPLVCGNSAHIKSRSS